MTDYDHHARVEVREWQRRMHRRPSRLDNLARTVQTRINRVIPEAVHQAITVAIKQLVRGVLFGADFVNAAPALAPTSLVAREMAVQQRIVRYRGLATAEGAATGAAGFLLGLTDFPLLLGLKLKLLSEIAGLYGFDVRQYPERVYLLLVFQLAFSSQHGRNAVFRQVEDWPATAAALPPDVHQLDWRTFQQEYRDYIDLAKLAQMLPVVGAAVGAVANYRLVQHLGRTATMCYRMRIFGAVDGLETEPAATFLPGG